MLQQGARRPDGAVLAWLVVNNAEGAPGSGVWYPGLGVAFSHYTLQKLRPLSFNVGVCEGLGVLLSLTWYQFRN
jgi:hypothetical protein